jgi:hypothetical protein
MKQAASIATFLVGLLFNLEDGSDMFLPNSDFQRITRRYILEDKILHGMYCSYFGLWSYESMYFEA